ncbi:FRG domain-containing protein [Bacillus cereus]|nr:FRG domain-containing protein [Bacillus cereus]
MTDTKRYSNRELTGVLPTPEEIVVEDLAGYIKLFSDGKFAKYYFRGEPTNYKETISSALRGKELYSFLGMKREFKDEYPFLNMKNEFKREVWHKLSSDERMHFSAFSQHHGIPTNLIDITTSPLVALYFASQKVSDPERNNENLDIKHGFVYLFKDSFVDITNILTKFEDDNILELFAYNKSNIFIDMYNLFLDFQSKNPSQFYHYLKNLNEEYHAYFENRLSKQRIPEKIDSLDTFGYKTIITSYTEEIKIHNKKLQQIYNQIDDVCDEVFLYTASLQMFLENILDGDEHIFWFNNIMPNFKYAPILSFERGRNQQGSFIYQNYLNYFACLINTPMLSRQRVWPSKIIVVENKENILKELDFIGINEKFIYGDYDNIANYIKRKFQ